MSKSNHTLSHLNCRSLFPNINDIRDILTLHSFSVLALTETWLTPNISDGDMFVSNYKLLRRDRGSRGGGVALYIRADIQHKILLPVSHLEDLWISMVINGINIIFGVVYRPPSMSTADFVDSFETTLSIHLPTCDELFCLGDLNIDVLNVESRDFLKLSDMLESFHLKQIVDRPTRVTHNTVTALDLIITTNEELVIGWDTLCADHISDHELVYCLLRCERVLRSVTYKTRRTFKNFNHELFLSDFFSTPFYNIFHIESIDDKIHYLNQLIIRLFNVHAPLRNFKYSKPYSPWLTENTRFLMSLRDKARKKWKVSKSTAAYNYYKTLRNFCAQVIRAEKRAYLNNRAFNLTNNIEIWKRLKTLGVLNDQPRIPDHVRNVNCINEYFIRSVPQSVTCPNLINYYNHNCKPDLMSKFSFRLIDELTIMRVFTKLKSGSAGSDGISLKMLSLCYPHIIPYLTHIINCCIQSSTFPSLWKDAQVVPIPKNKNPSDYCDLRPISILPVLSKILETVLQNQLSEFLYDNNVIPLHQSGFRSRHSCETALLSITDDIVRALDKGYATVLVLLDYSKAFDSLNHQTLLAILHYSGLNSDAISLINSYLKGRSQRVVLDDIFSHKVFISSGVPQGSILGPLLYSIYTSNIPSCISSCNMHLYADDTQLYFSFPPSEVDSAINAINEDLKSIARVSKEHSLFLNVKKSTAILFASDSVKEKISDLELYIEGDRINFSTKIKNLGVIIDDNLSFQYHVNYMLQRAYCALKLIYANRSLLHQKTKTLLCDSLVLSKFNFCDSLYDSFLSSVAIRKIQKLQNSCLRLIFGVRRHERISHRLVDAKWLNMQARRRVHRACLFHKIITFRSPPYLYLKITYRTDVHNLNLRHRGLLSTPFHRTEFFKKSFSYLIVSLYNSLPSSFKSLPVSSFKSKYICLISTSAFTKH